MTPEQVHAALKALNEARQKTLNQPGPDWMIDEQARAEYWQGMHELDEQVAEIEKAWPMFRVWYDNREETDSYVLVPRR